MSVRRASSLLLVPACFLALPAVASAAPVTIVSSDVQIFASGDGQEDRFETDALAGIDETVEITAAEGGEGGPSGFGLSTLLGGVSDEGFTAIGLVDFARDGVRTGAGFLFDVVFDVTAPATFEGRYSIVANRSQAEPTPPPSALEIGGFELRRVGDGDAAVLGPDRFSLDNPISEDLVTGDLATGRYRATFALDVAPDFLDDDDAARIDFDLQLSFAAADVDGGGGTPIPLPPAALAGLSVMAGAGAIGSIRKRLRGRA